MNLPLFIRQNGICNVIIGGMQRVAKKNAPTQRASLYFPAKKVSGSKFGKLFPRENWATRVLNRSLITPLQQTNSRPTFPFPTFDRFKSRGGGKEALIFEFWWENTSLLLPQGPIRCFSGNRKEKKNISFLAKILQSSA